MGDPYTDVSITGYNTSAPSDDGSTAESNRVNWSKHKDKLGDPLKTAIETMNTNVGAAIDKVAGGVTATATSYTVQSSDQGKTIASSGSGATITTPDATSVGSPFEFSVINLDSDEITLDGHDSQTIDGTTTISVPGGGGVRLTTDGTNWYTNGSNFAKTRVKPQGRLTLSTGVPIVVSDQASATSVYYTPYDGNLIPVPNDDGTDFVVREFSELTLSLNDPNHVADTIYDVYVYNDAGTIKIATGPAWTTSTAGSGNRGTGAGTAELTRLKGLLVNANSMTVRNGATTDTVDANEGTYVGSILIDGSAGQVTCHVTSGQSRKWGVWNAYNRVLIMCKGHDGDASWTYATATWRAADNSSSNVIDILTGLQEEWIDASYSVDASLSATNDGSEIAVGLNSTTSPSGIISHISDGQHTLYTAHYLIAPQLGRSSIYAMEYSDNNTTTYRGSDSEMMLAAKFMG